MCTNVQEVGTGTVHLVHIAQTQYVILVSLTPYGFRLGFYTAHSTERCDCTVQHTQRTFYFSREVHVPRGIDDVDLVGFILIVPESGGGSRSNGDTTFLFLHHPVHRCGTFMHLTDLVCFTRIEKDTFGSGCFTGIDVSHDTDISRIC